MRKLDTRSDVELTYLALNLELIEPQNYPSEELFESRDNHIDGSGTI